MRPTNTSSHMLLSHTPLSLAAHSATNGPLDGAAVTIFVTRYQQRTLAKMSIHAQVPELCGQPARNRPAPAVSTLFSKVGTKTALTTLEPSDNIMSIESPQPPAAHIDAHSSVTVRRRLPAFARQRGFTMVELLAVVAMVGILSALAIVGYRRYLNSAHTADAKAVIGSIRVAQESYRAETLGYLNASSSLTDWYPKAPDGLRHPWKNTSHARYAQWAMLNPATDSHTTFGFAVVAGGPGDTIPDLTTASKPTWTVPTEPWYVIQAAGDADDDGVFSMLAASSFNGEVYVEQEGE